MARSYGERTWRYRNLESGYEFTNRLHLEPEIDGSPMVGDLDTDDGEEQLAAYARYAERRLEHDWAADRIRIHWFVSSDQGQFSGAPWTDLAGGPTFLDEFTWPVDAASGEPLDFFRLPVVMDRFPAWAHALGWTPAPFTPAIPLRSRMASLRGLPRLERIEVVASTPGLEPESWYELLVDREDPRSDVWFSTIDEALHGVRDYLAGGSRREAMQLSWERADGSTGPVAEGEALALWAEGCAP